MNIRILLVDDHEIVLEGLHTLLDAEDGFTVAGTANTGEEALRRAHELRPDLIVLDIGLPDIDGIEVARALRSELPETRILALSMHSEREYVVETFKAGALGYLVKNTAFRELITAITTVMEGKRYLSSDLVSIILDDSLPEPQSRQSPFDVLSSREMEILHLLLAGQSSKEIAFTLNLSPKTVDFHRQQVMRKTGVDNLIDLTRLAIRAGLLEP